MDILNLMQQTFVGLLNMSITASFCAAAVFLLRMFLKRQPKIYSYVLWLAVFFRLVCPVSLESAMSFMKVSTQTVPQNIGMQDLSQWENTKRPGGMEDIKVIEAPGGSGSLENDSMQGIKAGSEHTGGVFQWFFQQDFFMPDPHDSVNPLQVFLFLAAMVWAAVLAVLVILSILSYVRLSRQLRGADLLEEGVYEKEGIHTPFVYGMLHPAIYLPKGLEEREKRFVLEHEKTHVRRRDYLVKQAAFFICCVHWFNPLVWLSFVLMCRDMEMSCDENVIRKIGTESRKEYSAALLTMASGRKIVLAGPLFCEKGGVRQRIANVLRYKKRKLWLRIALTAMVTVFLTGLLLNPEEEIQAGREYKNNTEKEVSDLKARTAQTAGNREEGKTVEGAQTVENKKMASAAVKMADGTVMTAELWMTKGKYYDENSKDYVPSIYAYGKNYEGRYEVRTADENGKILFQADLSSLWPHAGISDGLFNFPGKFELKQADYNADGCPDFSIGMPFSSNSMGFLLFTVRSDGTVERLCDEAVMEEGFEEFSRVFEHDVNAERMPVTGHFYNNVTGKTEELHYYYNAESGLYEREYLENETDENAFEQDGQMQPDAGRGNESEKNSQPDADSYGEDDYELTDVVHYTGYLDESPYHEWRNAFADKDFDFDGRQDRVYRDVSRKSVSYRIDFGNGSRLDFGKSESLFMIPEISSAKMPYEDSVMILFAGQHTESTDPFSGGDIGLYAGVGNEYYKIDLPKAEESWNPDFDKRAGYHMTESYDAEKGVITAEIKEAGKKLVLQPKEDVQDGFTAESSTAFDASFVLHHGKTCVALYQNAGGKWRQDIAVFVLDVHPAERSDRQLFDLELVFTGWAEEFEQTGVFTAAAAE